LENGHPRVDSVMDSQVSTWASMHLARTMRTVIGCKENMWEAYHELFSDQLLDQPVLPSAQDSQLVNPPDPVRDAFEIAWSNWER
jgi:hypothetical protein